MIHTNDRHRFHQFLMIELAIRYLKNDLEIINTTKFTNIFTPFILAILKQLQKQYKQEKQYFKTKQIQLIRWKRIDQYFSEVTVATAGEDTILTYANQAVKMHIEELIIDTYRALRQNTTRKRNPKKQS